MQERYLFEYAIVRVVPRVEREEFMNVGVILYCPSKAFLKFIFNVNEARLTMLSPEMEISEIRKYLEAFEKVSIGGKPGGVIGSLPSASRFRWLTASRSTVVQSSKVHPGLCVDPEVALRDLFTRMVL